MQENKNSATTGRGNQNKLIVAFFIILLLVGADFCYQCAKKPHFRKVEIAKPQIEKVKITGEVVDAWCYASQTMGPGRGEGHKACAMACGYGGVTMGILEDGSKDLYIAAKSSKPYKGCNDLLIPYTAQKVTVTGWAGTLGGSRVLKIETITPLEETKTDPGP